MAAAARRRVCQGPALLYRAVCVLLCAAAAAAPLHFAAGAVSDENATHSHGWARGADSSLAGPCTVERRAVAELSQAEFDAVYLVRACSFLQRPHA